jgi:hypothetical protein
VKLRVKGNTLRLRLNQSEVRRVAAGGPIQERIAFPGCAPLKYVLKPADSGRAAAFAEGVITVSATIKDFESWAASDALGLYFDIPAEQDLLKIAIEKDLECLDAPPSERDPDAFPRSGPAASC